MYWEYFSLVFYLLYFSILFTKSYGSTLNVNGQPNEFMSKQVVVAFIPCFIIFSYGFLYIISHNIFKFNEREHGIIGGFIKKITLFMLFIHTLILFINFGDLISFQTGLTIGISMFLLC